VIAVELQGHGRTADIDRPMAIETLADDVVTLLGPRAGALKEPGSLTNVREYEPSRHRG
jgi:hypothetical protein